MSTNGHERDWWLVHSAWCLVHSAWYLVRDMAHKAPGTLHSAPCTKHLVHEWEVERLGAREEIHMELRDFHSCQFADKELRTDGLEKSAMTPITQ